MSLAEIMPIPIILILCYCVCVSGVNLPVKNLEMSFGSGRNRFDNDCDKVCIDLPEDDLQPVCMTFSRFKKGYQYFVNQCHARRTICKENLVLHMVHPSRCKKAHQFFHTVH